MYDKQVQKQTEASPLSGIKVLLVEDEPDIEDLFTYILQMYGAEVIVAHSAYEALSQLGLQQPAVVVSNVRLPDQDGCWLVRQLQELEDTLGKIPAIAVTSYTRQFNRQAVLDAGFHHFLSKPVDPNELVREILKLV
jgi:CheY-like chemotaxis protein